MYNLKDLSPLQPAVHKYILTNLGKLTDLPFHFDAFVWMYKET